MGGEHMFSKRILFSALAIILLTAGAYAQGDYLELGENGGQVGLQFFHSRGAYGIYDIYGVNINGGISYYGMVDGRFSLGIADVEGEISSENAVIITPSLSVYPLKQGLVGLPFSANLVASFQIANYVGGSTGLSELSYNFRGGLLSNIDIVESFVLQPNIGVAYQHPKDDWDNKVNSLNVGLSMFLTKVIKYRVLRLDFMYSDSEKVTSFGFQLGIIFESHKEKADERWDW
jgi:hypothetical protein